MMLIEHTLILMGAAIAWDTFWFQVFIQPFFNKREGLVRDYVNSGMLDAAKSHIDENKLLPEIAVIVMNVMARIPRKCRDSSEVQPVLQEVSFIDELRRAQHALGEKSALDSLLKLLERDATRVWAAGMVHAVIVLSMAGIPFADADYQPWLFCPAVLLAVVSLAMALFCLMRFNVSMGRFLDLLTSNRLAGGLINDLE